MYAGAIVEEGDVEQILRHPRHPYTMGLRLAYADLGVPENMMISIGGTPPELGVALPGCAFAPRCPFAIERCRAVIPALAGNAAYRVACHRAAEAEALRAAARNAAVWERP